MGKSSKILRLTLSVRLSHVLQFIKDASGSVSLPNTQLNYVHFSFPFPLDTYKIQLVQMNEFKVSDTQNDGDLLNTFAAFVATL